MRHLRELALARFAERIRLSTCFSTLDKLFQVEKGALRNARSFQTQCVYGWQLAHTIL
jgi:hypothetical protein